MTINVGYKPFYWRTSDAFRKVQELQEISDLYIATAYIEKAGVDWIKMIAEEHFLPKEKINVFLSTAFSLNQPSEILTLLCEIATVHIVFQKKLHAKTILALNNDQGLLIMGSANLTYSGMNENIELTNVEHVSSNSSNIKYFYDHLERMSCRVDNKIINEYRKRESTLQKIEHQDDLAEKITTSIFTSSDPVLPSKDDLNGFYFTYEDYETLFPRNGSVKTDALKQKREVIQQKMLCLHKQLKSFANQRNLHEHWQKKHITSLIVPSVYNYGMVTWLAIRYGKSEKQIRALNPDLVYGDEGGFSFPKHGCIQMSLSADGFSISLFHAVKHNAWDRAYVHDKISNSKSYLKEVLELLENLKGYGYEWHFYDPVKGEGISFSIDENDLSQFEDFYKKDKEGLESFFITTYEHDDLYLKYDTTIVELVKEHFDLLQPLYDKMVQVAK